VRKIDKIGVTRCNRIKSRCHGVARTVAGRFRYPFTAMLVNDYFVVTGDHRASKVRNAVKTFCRKHSGRKFSVKAYQLGQWICRREQ